MYVESRISIPVGSGDAGNDKIASVLPTLAATNLSGDSYPSVHIADFRTDMESFKPNWESLRRGYLCPELFRDAKFGIWAH